MTKQMRDPLIDSLRGIAILIVIMGHALQNANASPSLPVLKIIMTFWMPLFFLISGFSAGYGRESSLRNGLKKKVLRLLVPYLCWAEIVYAVDLFRFDRCFSLMDNVVALFCSPFWFLRMLFGISALFVVYRSIVSGLNGCLKDAKVLSEFIAVVASFLLTFLVSFIPGFGSILHFAPLFAMGYFLFRAQSFVDARWIRIGSLVLSLLFAFSIPLMFFNIGNIGMFLLDKSMAITGSAAIYSLVKNFPCAKDSKILILCGTHSLELYAVHWCIFFWFNLLHLHRFVLDGGSLYLIGGIGAVVWLLFSAIIIWLISKTKWMRFFLFGGIL